MLKDFDKRWNDPARLRRDRNFFIAGLSYILTVLAISSYNHVHPIFLLFLLGGALINIKEILAWSARIRELEGQSDGE